MIKDKKEIKDDKKTEKGKSDVSKRRFIKAAALGVVAASAGFSKFLVSKSSDTARKRANINYMKDDLQQEKVMSQKQLVLMTDEEKKEMLNELLDHHFAG